MKSAARKGLHVPLPQEGSSVELGAMSNSLTPDTPGDEDDIEQVSIQVVKEGDRAEWGSKVQFLLSVVGYAVGLGNIWRFPYLCQQNGGGAFLIPYCIMLIFEGIPLFYLELGIGQKLRKGSIGVWNEIHPYLGGLGISSTVVAFLVGMYYNAILMWCFYYLFRSFTLKLPWSECPVDMTDNGTVVHECHVSSATSYFWYRKALDISPGIDDTDGIRWPLLGCLFCAWVLVYVCIMRGIKSSGKVVYFTATFPYVVLIIFCGRALTLKGAGVGLRHMFTPNIDLLRDPTVWLDAATQIFYSLGLAFGSLIAFASYNPPTSNCRRDAIVVSLINCSTSLFASIVVFAVLGFKAVKMHESCIEDALLAINETGLIPDLNASLISTEQELEELLSQHNETIYHLGIRPCRIADELNQAAEGTGLAFIVFTQAIVELPGAPLWSVLFFLMLLTLGLGSMFGTEEGVITSIFDMNLFTWMRKEILSGIVCGVSFFTGIIFVTGSGEYWLKLFDTFSGTMSLMAIAFFEVVGVMYIYGFERFSDDLEDMVGQRPGIYWQATWRFIGPLLMLIVFISSVAVRLTKPLTYKAYNKELGISEEEEYPWWATAVCIMIVLAGMLPIPTVAVLRFFNIMKIETDIPMSVKKLNTTPSTTAMIGRNAINHDNGDDNASLDSGHNSEPL